MKKWLFPPIWLMLILTAISTAGLTFVFVKQLEESPIAYVIYVLAFYTLVVISIFCVRTLPKKFSQAKRKMNEHPLGNRYLTDAAFRTQVSLYGSLGINLLYVGINLLSYVLYRSNWFICLGVYYVILSIMRYFLANYGRKNGFGKKLKSEWKRVLPCAYILLTINFALTGSVLMILYQNKGFQYHGILIYVMALYTFYVTIHASISLVKKRKYESPVLTMSGVVTLSAALVSMLSLETAMLSQFGGEMSADSKWLMIVLTGAGVSIVIVCMSIYMIIKSTKETRKLRGK